MIIKVKVKPNANKEEVKEDNGNYLISIKERPEKGRANLALIKLLARHFRISSSNVKIVRGFKSNDKIVEINKD